jgi:hypothetical protein
VADTTQASASIGFDDLRIEQCGSGHPAGCGRGACSLAAWWLDPVPIRRQQCPRLLLESIGEAQRHTVRRQDLGDLMHHALGHSQGAVTAVDRQQQLTHRVNGAPDLVRCRRQGLDRPGIVDLTSVDRPEEGTPFVQLPLGDADFVQEMAGKGRGMVRHLDQPGWLRGESWTWRMRLWTPSSPRGGVAGRGVAPSPDPEQACREPQDSKQPKGVEQQVVPHLSCPLPDR